MMPFGVAVWLAAGIAVLQGVPGVVQVGRVTAVYWSGDEGIAAALAELADRPYEWPGIGTFAPDELRLIVARRRIFDSVTAGRVPGWGAGAAFPGSKTVVVRLGGDARRVLKHELAHLALHSVVRRPPRWFDEGYAAFAAGEWGRLDALRVNLEILRGRIPDLRELDAALRAGTGEAEAAYALATTAVLLLNRLGGPRGLEPLIKALSSGEDFDGALRITYGMTLGQFETLWREDLRGRYGWLVLGTSLAVLWAVVLAVVGTVWGLRRRRYREKKKALDEGWVVDA
ncbi:MAG: hypothetical protein KatS3mg081_0671 [Gemmatimonadales bacterium]|nr:MAG: hypothetical protein KatS3mg081_0671 [Gemmatimonadales bacterium]